MPRFPEIWEDQLASLKSIAEAIADSKSILIQEASNGVSQQRILDVISSKLSGLDDMIDRLEHAGATTAEIEEVEEVEEVEDIRSLLEDTSLGLKIHQVAPKS